MKTKTKRWNIMSVNVDISDNKFSKSKISINRGKHIRFKSTDGNSYTVDCGEQDSDISDDFPFTVPGDNKVHKLKIKEKAKKQDYTCSITSGTGSEKMLMSAIRPTMIIEVG